MERMKGRMVESTVRSNNQQMHVLDKRTAVGLDLFRIDALRFDSQSTSSFRCHRFGDDLAGIDHGLAFRPMETLHRLEQVSLGAFVDAQVAIEVGPLTNTMLQLLAGFGKHAGSIAICG